MVCQNCSTYIPDGSVLCPTCGVSLASKQASDQQNYQQPGQQGYYQQPRPQGYYQQPRPQGYYQQPRPQGYYQQPRPQGYYQQPFDPDIPSDGLKALCFFFPIVGLILYLTSKDTKPISAQAYGKMALISVCIGAGVLIFYIIILLALTGSIASFCL